MTATTHYSDTSHSSAGSLLSRASRRLRRTPRPLALLLLLGALLSLGWDAALPAFQGPDENAHFAYVQYLAETGNVPSSTRGSGSYSQEVAQAQLLLNLSPLMGDLAMKPAWSRADLALWQREDNRLSARDRSDGSGPNPIAKNPPLYYAVMAVPYRIFVWLPLLKRLFVMRLCNALFYLATIALTWLLAGEVFGRSLWRQTLAAGAVALEPQLSFMSAVINADNLLIAAVTAFLYTAVRLVRRGPSTGRVLAMGFASAVAVLTQGRGLVTIPVLLVALLVAWISFRPDRLRALRDAAGAGALVIVAILALYLVQRSSGSSSLYGGQASSLNANSFNVLHFLSFGYQFFFPKLASMAPRVGPAYGFRQVFINTFFASFGWLEVNFAPRLYDILEVLSVIGIAWTAATCIVRRSALRESWGPAVVLATMLVVQVVFLLYVSYQALLGDAGSDPLIVGRYLLPIISLFGLAITFTIGSLPRRVAPVLGGCLLSAEAVLLLASLGLTASRFYA